MVLLSPGGPAGPSAVPAYLAQRWCASRPAWVPEALCRPVARLATRPLVLAKANALRSVGGVAPETPPASSLEVVALLAGVVWTLPVWLFLGENALEWSLPVGAAPGDATSARS